MSMLSEQADELRSWADQLSEREDEFGVVVRALVADLREAADTIESLRKQVAKCQIAELKADCDTSRYFELFGTPERAARTLYYGKQPICAGCALLDECDKMPDEERDTCLLVGYDDLLEWLMGDAE